jgi:Tfp pilus assembly protein PilF
MCYHVRAMALAKSGQTEEAAKAFRQAEESYANRAVVGRDDLGAFENWMIDEMFAKEARAMFATTEPAPSP